MAVDGYRRERGRDRRRTRRRTRTRRRKKGRIGFYFFLFIRLYLWLRFRILNSAEWLLCLSVDVDCVRWEMVVTVCLRMSVRFELRLCKRNCWERMKREEERILFFNHIQTHPLRRRHLGINVRQTFKFLKQLAVIERAFPKFASRIESKWRILCVWSEVFLRRMLGRCQNRKETVWGDEVVVLVEECRCGKRRRRC